MKKMAVVIACILCAGFIYKAFYIWQEIRVLKRESLMVVKETEKYQMDRKYLESLSDGRIESFENNYKELNEKIRLFSRYHNFKVSIKLDKINKDGLVSQTMGPSLWLGIKRSTLHLYFYDLTETHQHIIILRFLNNIELSDPISIVNIVQKGNQIETELELYGRGI